MCGISGFLGLNGRSPSEAQGILRAMSDSLAHRGPDDSGIWVDAEAGVALGHRRLSILDLSPEGHQPMLSACGRYVIVFNGEVYNFEELRNRLVPRGHTFRGGSDTEVMLAAIEEWGLVAAVKEFIGMFAFALWDRRLHKLHLVRDRVGIKPLYYGWAGKCFLFASQLKAMRAHPDFLPEVNRDTLALQLRHNYVPYPHSIYRGIYKLPPGCIVTLGREEMPTCRSAEPVPYWSARDVFDQAASNPFCGSEREAVERLDALLRDAVRLRMVADVPLGAFLSGGIDSSTVVALMQAQSSRPVKTFTIGFHEVSYNEAGHAKAVAQHLGTDHTELYLTPEETREIIPELSSMYDEPFSDSSEIPTCLVSALARRHVKVSLSGDGGDELFGGYNRYFRGSSLWKGIRRIPIPIRQGIGWGLSQLSPERWDRLWGRIEPILPARFRVRLPGEKLQKLIEFMTVASSEEFYRCLVSHWKNPTEVVVASEEPATILADEACLPKVFELTELMMYLDFITFLPDDILTKVDRASMAVGLEARIPILDHRIVSFAASLPLSMKIRNGQGKWLLRQVLYRYVPRALIERPKMGFAVPIGAWLRGPLREWGEDLLATERLKREGYFNPEPIRKLWTEHLSGRRNWQYYLWDVLMFQTWYARWK